MTVVLDANILLRLADPTAPQYTAANAAVTLLRQQANDLRPLPQSLYEFWVVATRPTANNGLGLTVAEAAAELARIDTIFPVLNDTPALLAEWRALVAAHDCKGKVAHDARYVAAMRTHGLTDILTFNGADFARFPGLTVLDPHAVAAHAPQGGTP